MDCSSLLLLMNPGYLLRCVVLLYRAVSASSLESLCGTNALAFVGESYRERGFFFLRKIIVISCCFRLLCDC